MPGRRLGLDASAMKNRSPVAPPASPERPSISRSGVDAEAHTIHAAFERLCDASPSRRAISTSRASLTYGDLEARSNRLAAELLARGLNPGEIVGVHLDRTARLPAALLAILKAGGTYLPLDPDYPRDRLTFMLEDSGCRSVVHEGGLDLAVPRSSIDVERDSEAISTRPAERPPVEIDPDDLAYVIYTSGSTGRPKGVEIRHRSVVNFLRSMAERPGLSPNDVLLALTTISFDISVLELFLPLSVGAEIRLVDRETASDGHLLSRELDDSAATVMQATPATWRMLLDADWPGRPGLRALCGGEALPPQLAERLLSRCDELWNLYGPTETTVWSTVARIESSHPPISIGEPIDRTQVHVVDSSLRRVEDGGTGELLIGGDGLARGYRGRPGLTADRFVPAPEWAAESDRLYRTGDLARRLPDGTLACLGRIDHQLKIRGFRIEPGEIERVAEGHPDVSTAVVVAREDATGLQRLVGYLVPASPEADRPAVERQLRVSLRDELPPQMTPSVFHWLEELPLTGSGKVDRGALPEPLSAATFEPTGGLPGTATEQAIAEAWEEVLEVSPIGLEDDFFSLGGHSLLLHRVRNRLQDRLGIQLAMVELTRHPTVAALATHLSDREQGTCDDTGVYGRGNPHPLATMARRFLIPRSLLTLWFMWKFKAKVSPRAEVEPSRFLDLGRGTTIGSFTKVKADKGPLVIGERSSFANGCFIGSGPAGLRIGANLVCGPNVTIVPSSYVVDEKNVHLADQGHTSQGIAIGDNVWIGAGSTILDGSELGDNTIVSAGSVVDRKFPGDCVLRGNPAEIVTER